MKQLSGFFVLFIVFTLSCKSQMNVEFKGDGITFMTEDHVKVSGDLYLTKDEKAPLILLFHQAGYSRGEYRPIAPTLNKLGFNCLAIDQRSGNEVNGVSNETNREALNLGKATKYPDAIPDLEAALNYAKNKLGAQKVIIWGSSYSSSLVFYLASKYPKDVKAILSFSPGEYFTIDGNNINSFAKQVQCPVFITSAKNEQDSWQSIYDGIPSEKSFFLPEEKGFHGSKALWSINNGHENYWLAVKEFLESVKK